jgi:hypothetical protein
MPQGRIQHHAAADVLDEAAKYAPLEQRHWARSAVFPAPCAGNNIAVPAQRDKLRRVVETAAEVWSWKILSGERR